MTTKDAVGQRSTSWTLVRSSVPASARDTNGKELEAAQSISGEVVTEFVMRATPLTNQNRLVEGAVIYEILAVLFVDERRRWIKAICRSGVNEG